MDTSEKYILMCSKAQEIQSMIDFGENYSFPSENRTDMVQFTVLPKNKSYSVRSRNPKLLSEVVSVEQLHDRFVHVSGCHEMADAYSVIWLPRQDQLQEMIMSNYGNNLNLLSSFQLFFMDADDTESFNMSYFRYSFEKLWLTFVMMEKFNKVWSEEHRIWHIA